ncbi:MAG TPA: EthD family reductase [Terracidiphilus sp.]|nr:EthD family reductase [Terracidiphilus sp.]
MPSARGLIVESMVKVSIFYPGKAGSFFDVDYYLGTHIPLAISLLGAAIKAVSVEIGVLGGNPDQPPPFTAICGFTCDSAQAFTDAFLPNAEILQNDIPKYTNITPVIQVSEIRLHQQA